MKWSGLLSAHPRIVADQPPVLLPLGAVHLLGQGLGKRKKKYFRLLQVESDSYHFKLINFHCYCYTYVEERFFGKVCVKSTQGEILPNPVVCITPLNMFVREDTKYLPVTKTSIGTIEDHEALYLTSGEQPI